MKKFKCCGGELLHKLDCAPKPKKRHRHFYNRCFIEIHQATDSMCYESYCGKIEYCKCGAKKPEKKGSRE